MEKSQPGYWLASLYCDPSKLGRPSSHIIATLIFLLCLTDLPRSWQTEPAWLSWANPTRVIGPLIPEHRANNENKMLRPKF